MAAELPIRKAAAKMIQTLHLLDLPQLWNHTGLNFEKLHGLIEPINGEQLYSLRVTRSARAIICLVSGPAIVLVNLHSQHDDAYRTA